MGPKTEFNTNFPQDGISSWEKNKNIKNVGSSTDTSSVSVESSMRLKREIGLLEAISITIGSIIGAGIFISPKGITAQVHSIGASLVIWLICGILSLLGAFCFAELGTTFPSAGGQYTYIYQSCGPLLAFLSLWTSNIMFVPIGNAITGLVFAKYIAQPFFPGTCEIPDSAVQLLAAVAICLLSFMNCCDIKVINRFNNIFMVLKLTAVGLVIAGGMFALRERGTVNFFDIWSDSKITAESLIFSIYSGSFAYGGWTAMSTMMEELKNPYKNLPKAIFISLSLVTFIYLLANASYFLVLSPQEIILSDAVAVTFVNELIGPSFVWIVPVFVSLSTFGFLSLHIMTSSRNCFVGARHGHLPSVLGLITTAYHTPATAIMFQSSVSLIFLYTADVFALISFYKLVQWFFQTLCIGGLIYLRLSKPQLPRPYKVPLIIPIVYFVISLFFIVVPIYVSPVQSAISVTVTLSGLPVYYLIQGVQTETKRNGIIERLTVMAQKVMVSVPEG